MQGMDAVVHLAALASVPESMRHPVEAVETNIQGLVTVLEEAVAAGVRKLVFASSAAVVHAFISQALAGEPLTVSGDGSQTRDFIYVEDVVAAILRALEAPGLHGVYNIGSGTETSIATLAQSILRLTGSPSPIHFISERGGDIRR